MTRVLVTGSRDWGLDPYGVDIRSERMMVYRALHEHGVLRYWTKGYDEHGEFVDWIRPDDFVVVHGDCPTGADRIADDWCLAHNFTAERHPADWGKYGREAGLIRNREMVERGADVCLSFIKNQSRGATYTTDLAKKAGIRVMRYTVSTTRSLNQLPPYDDMPHPKDTMTSTEYDAGRFERFSNEE